MLCGHLKILLQNPLHSLPAALYSTLRSTEKPTKEFKSDHIYNAKLYHRIYLYCEVWQMVDANRLALKYFMHGEPSANMRHKIGSHFMRGECEWGANISQTGFCWAAAEPTAKIIITSYVRPG